MKNDFQITPTTKYLLYGAATVGKITLDSMVKMGLTVQGFIDKRADEIGTFCNLPVWRPSRVPSEEKTNPNTVVFVAVKNVFEHEMIAESLRKEGLLRLIYKPYATLINETSEADAAMDKVFSQISEGHFSGSAYVPDLSEVSFCQKDYGIICEDGNYVVARIPIDFIFTNDYDSRSSIWGNLNIFSFFTHLDFFHYLSGDLSVSPFSYLTEHSIYSAKQVGNIKITDAWKQNVLRNRAQIYREMCQSLQMDPDFFSRNAPTAVWSEEHGYFNLTSGKHRTVFLASKGYYTIPLRIIREEYAQFLNLSKVKAVKEQVLCTKTKIQMPIPHPYFYRMPGASADWYYGILSRIVCNFARRIYWEIGRIDFSRMTLLLDMEENGALSAFFLRLGFMVYQIAPSEPVSETIRLLGYVQSSPEVINPDESRAVDVVVTDILTGQWLTNTAISCRRECYAICRTEEDEARVSSRLTGWQTMHIYNTIRDDGDLTLLRSTKKENNTDGR